MAHDIQASSNKRKIRFRLRQKEKARLAAADEKRQHRAALDASRIARGQKPALTDVERQAAVRAKQAILKETCRTSWFAPPLTNAEWSRYAEEKGWDAARARERRESAERAARIAALNVNRFVLENACARAVDLRLHFSEAHAAGMSIAEALKLAETAAFVARGRTSAERQANTWDRYEAAKWEWFGREDEILAAVLGKAPEPKSDKGVVSHAFFVKVVFKTKFS